MLNLRRWLIALSLAGGVLCASAHAADIYGYVDERGVAHFAAEKIDPRYQLFFKGGQSFDTAQGLGVPGQKMPNGKPPSAAQALLALFEKSPSYGTTKTALREAAKRHAIDYELLQALVAAESGFDAQAVSPKGAIGLMQLMPATAQRYGVQADKKHTLETKLHDPRINIATGSRYLRDLIAQFEGRLELALAAYNAGEGAVQRAGNKIPNYRETQNYVQTVMQLYAWLKPDAGTTWTRAGGRNARAPVRVRMEMAGADADAQTDAVPSSAPPPTPTDAAADADAVTAP